MAAAACASPTSGWRPCRATRASTMGWWARPPTWHPKCARAARRRRAVTSTAWGCCSTRPTPAVLRTRPCWPPRARRLGDAGHSLPKTRNRALSAEVSRVIGRCLETDPARRPSSALDVAVALPGGDPIAAALAAGRTLEPELLAAAGARQRAMSPGIAALCVTALVVGLAATLTVAPHTRVVSGTHMKEPPAAMQTRARLMLQALGFPDPGDAADGFSYDQAVVDRVAIADRSNDRWTRLFASGQPVIRFWHRESPRALSALGMLQRVTPSDPEPNVPGMVAVQLDLRGRLQRLDAVPISGASAVTEPNWSALFTAAGLSADAFTSVEPATIPPSYADHRIAWDGPAGAPAAQRLHIEAAAFGASPVLFAVTPAEVAAVAASPKSPRAIQSGGRVRRCARWCCWSRSSSRRGSRGATPRAGAAIAKRPRAWARCSWARACWCGCSAAITRWRACRRSSRWRWRGRCTILHSRACSTWRSNPMCATSGRACWCRGCACSAAGTTTRSSGATCWWAVS